MIFRLPPYILLLLCASLLLQSGCQQKATYKNGVFSNARTVYAVAPPSGGWKRIKPEGADLAFWNHRLKAFIMVNSTCDRYRDAPPATLANHLYIGFTDKEYLEQKEVKVSGRDAAYMIVQGKLDGAWVKIASVTLVKNYCTYDLTYHAPFDTFEKGLKAFHDTAKKFKVIRRKKNK